MTNAKIKPILGHRKEKMMVTSFYPEFACKAKDNLLFELAYKGLKPLEFILYDRLNSIYNTYSLFCRAVYVGKAKARKIYREKNYPSVVNKIYFLPEITLTL